MTKILAGAVALTLVMLPPTPAAADHAPPKIVDVPEFIPGAARPGERGPVPDRGERLTFKVIEILGEDEVLIQEGRVVPGGRGIPLYRQFILRGNPTDKLKAGGPIALAGQGFRAVRTRKIGAQDVLIIEPDEEAAKRTVVKSARDAQVEAILDDLPVAQRRAVARQEAAIKRLQRRLQESGGADERGTRAIKAELDEAQALLERMKKDPLEAAPALGKRSGVGAWGRLPSPLLVRSAGADAAMLEHRSDTDVVTVFQLAGKPPADWKVGAKVKAPGIYLVTATAFDGPTVTRVELPAPEPAGPEPKRPAKP